MSSPAKSPPAKSPPTSRRVPLAQQRMRWLIFLILVGPCTALQAPLEVGRWKLAAAVQARADGQSERAYAGLEDAMRWMPGSPKLYLERAEWKLADGKRDEAFADNDKMLEFAGDSLPWLKIHSDFLYSAGRRAEAVADWKKIDELSQRSGKPSRVEALNSLAYYQALSNIELEEALQHANEALELAPQDAGILDTRGYVNYQLGRYTAALDDMNRAINLMLPLLNEALQTKPPRQLPPSHAKLMDSQPHTGTERVSISKTVAVLLYHRSLVYEAVGNSPLAGADRAQARSLIGREPDETLF